MKFTILTVFIICTSLNIQAQKNVGIGIPTPLSRLHLHQDNLTLDPTSKIQLTNVLTGSTPYGGLTIEQMGITTNIRNQENGLLSIGTADQLRLHLLANGTLGYNTMSTLGSADFTIRSQNDFFGGMYIDSPNTNADGKPFYGYSLDNNIALFHYYDAVDDRLKFQFASSETTFSFEENGNFLLNTSTPINSSTDLTLKTRGANFGGMYIDSHDYSAGKPFYGYAINGNPEAFHYFDAQSQAWELNVGGGSALLVKASDRNVGLSVSDPDEKLVVNGRVRLISSSTTSALDGTIVYNGSNFYGRINGGWYKMTNATAGQLQEDAEGQSMRQLKKENTNLKDQLWKMEDRLDRIEAKLNMQSK